MSLYLCVFEGATERASVEVGPYGYFGAVRDRVRRETGGDARFPTFLLHPDSQGTWRVETLETLEQELLGIRAALVSLQPVLVSSDEWYLRLALKLKRKNLNDSVIDVDGLPLFDRLLDLTTYARSIEQPILFQ